MATEIPDSVSHPLDPQTEAGLDPLETEAASKSFQDLDFDSDDPSGLDDASSSQDDEDEAQWLDQADLADLMSEEERREMFDDLKEIGLFDFLHKYVLGGKNIPVKRMLLQFGIIVPSDEELSEAQLLRLLKIAASKVLRQREKLPQYSSIDDAVRLIAQSRNILVLTGAGVSTSCGIPDFRSADGLYAQLAERFDDLDDPQQIFDIEYFQQNPEAFFSIAKHIFPSNFDPSPSHRFVKLLEHRNRLLRNYTQNIDTLETQAGVQHALQCHGSFATATCILCHTHFPGSVIEAEVLRGEVPMCPNCRQTSPSSSLRPGEASSDPRKDSAPDDDSDEDDYAFDPWAGKPIVKPDITFFGEKLSDTFDHALLEDRGKVDLLIVMGTSLKVAPVSEILSHIPHRIPQILINRDPISHFTLDICLLGDADVIVQNLCHRLEEVDPGTSWDLDAMKSYQLPKPVSKGTDGGLESLQPQTDALTIEVPPHIPYTGPVEPQRIGRSHFWLYPGADKTQRYLQKVIEVYSDSPSHPTQSGLGLPPASTSGTPTSRSRPRSPEVEGDEVDAPQKKTKTEVALE